MTKERQLLSAREIIAKRKSDTYINQGYQNLFLRIIAILLVCGFLFTNIFLITQVTGNDMFPGLKDGDLILAFRMSHEYSKNDVVLYNENGTLRVGRIVARENDVVTLNESGSLLVNGTVQSGEILYPTYSKDALTYPFVVPANHFFVLGDYRTQATDSRDFGPISYEDIEANIITLIRRRSI